MKDIKYIFWSGNWTTNWTTDWTADVPTWTADSYEPPPPSLPSSQASWMGNLALFGGMLRSGSIIPSVLGYVDPIIMKKRKEVAETTLRGQSLVQSARERFFGSVASFKPVSKPFFTEFTGKLMKGTEKLNLDIESAIKTSVGSDFVGGLATGAAQTAVGIPLAVATGVSAMAAIATDKELRSNIDVKEATEGTKEILTRMVTEPVSQISSGDPYKIGMGAGTIAVMLAPAKGLGKIKEEKFVGVKQIMASEEAAMSLTGGRPAGPKQELVLQRRPAPETHIILSPKTLGEIKTMSELRTALFNPKAGPSKLTGVKTIYAEGAAPKEGYYPIGMLGTIRPLGYESVVILKPISTEIKTEIIERPGTSTITPTLVTPIITPMIITQQKVIQKLKEALVTVPKMESKVIQKPYALMAFGNGFTPTRTKKPFKAAEYKKLDKEVEEKFLDKTEKKKLSPWFPASYETASAEEFLTGKKAVHIKGRKETQKLAGELIKYGKPIPTLRGFKTKTKKSEKR